jgi:hypothetical protein
MAPKNAALRQLKGQTHKLGFTPLGYDFNRISKQFSELISTDLLERYIRFKTGRKPLVLGSQYDFKKLPGRTKALPGSMCMTLLIFRVAVDQLTP